jgi:hypothetical protein
MQACRKEAIVTVHLRYRDGGRESVSDPADYGPKIRQLVADLCEEQFPRPDYEHSEAWVTDANGWSVGASMMGAISLSYWPTGVHPTRYLYGLPPEELVQVMVKLAQGRLDEIQAMPWQEMPVQGKADYYLYRNCPDMMDLHRAASKGDCEWIRTELTAGADVNAKDRDGATPLHRAAIAGHVDACRLLIASGADVEARDVNGSTVVDYAGYSDDYLDFIETRKLQELLGAGRAAL